MRKIIAIGGGSVSEGETYAIDKEIVNQTGKKKPNALFIPTASYDDRDYWQRFNKAYRERLNCSTDVLYLLENKPDLKEAGNKIKNADLIYVGGGNTLKMMRRWRLLGVDKMIYTAVKNGTVCAGLSAGALCWFAYGHSDSKCYYNPDDWDYVRVKCLGIVPATLCPHYDAEKRDQSFEQMILKYGGIGIAVDNNAAIEVLGDQYRIITSQKNAGAYKVIRKQGKIISTEIPVKSELREMGKLLNY